MAENKSNENGSMWKQLKRNSQFIIEEKMKEANQ